MAPIISSLTIIRTLSLFHIMAAYCFLTNPRLLADQNAVFMLGEAMKIPHAESINKPTESTAFIGIVLALLGVADITAASMNEHIAIEYWLANVPARLAFLYALTFYVYLFKEGGWLAPQATLHASIGEPLQNSLVLAFGFLEIAIWSWVFSTVRDERRDLVRRRVEEEKAAEDRL